MIAAATRALSVAVAFAAAVAAVAVPTAVAGARAAPAAANVAGGTPVPGGGDPSSVPIRTDCPGATSVTARYLVTRDTPNGASGEAGRRERRAERELYREPRRVLHVDRTLGVADQFAMTPNDRVRSVRYFDGPERAIAYEPADLALVRTGGADAGDRSRWWRPDGWLDGAAIERSRLLGTDGEGCDRLERRVLLVPGARVELEWYPALDLPKRQRVERDGVTVVWELLERDDDPERVEAAFASRADYAEIDFADVGDSESDPFVRRMIVLGFVEHPDGSGHAH